MKKKTTDANKSERTKERKNQSARQTGKLEIINMQTSLLN